MEQKTEKAVDTEAIIIKKNIEIIAKDILNIDTLDTRHSDSLDFYNVPVWGVEDALRKAYELGASKVERSKGLWDTKDEVLLGMTTLRRMLDAVYNENDPLCDASSDCEAAKMAFEYDPSIGEEPVYVYYYPNDDESIMTTIEGDAWGLEGSSARFGGKVILESQTTKKR